MQVRPPAALHTAPTGYARAGKACFERSLPLGRRVHTSARRLRGCQTVTRLGYTNELVGQVVAAQATATTERAISAGTIARVPIVELPIETAQAFKKQFESLQKGLDWFHDSTLFSRTARVVLDSTCSEHLLQQLSEMTTSINAPSALLLSGLPLEDVVPPTLGDLPISKESQLTEALVFAFASLWGHCYAYEGMESGGSVRDVIASKTVGVNSTTELQMHRDYPFVSQQAVPLIRLLTCMRPDKARQAATYVCDNRQLVEQLTAREVELLRSNPITFVSSKGKLVGAKPTIEGPENDPVVNLFDAGAQGVKHEADDPAAVDAYERAASVAKEIAVGVKLQEGQMLIINNNRATHGRTGNPVEADGYGRWLKVASVRPDIDPSDRFIARA